MDLSYYEFDPGSIAQPVCGAYNGWYLGGREGRVGGQRLGEPDLFLLQLFGIRLVDQRGAKTVGVVGAGWIIFFHYFELNMGLMER